MLFPETWISYISIISLLIIVWMMIGGYKDGFLLKLCDLFATVLSIVVAVYIVKNFGEQIQIIPQDVLKIGDSIELSLFLSLYANQIVLFLASFLIVRLLFTLIRPLLKGLNKIPILGFLNKTLGILAGFIQAYIVLVLITMVFSSPLFLNGNQVLKESRLIMIQDSANQVLSYMNTQYETIKDMKDDPKYTDDDYGNIKIWFDYYGLDKSLQEQFISVIKNRSE